VIGYVESSELEALATLAADGDRPAAERLLAVIRPRVLRHCQRLLPFREDAEDACQEALIKVSERIETFGGRSLFVTWLSQVTANSARDTYRRLRRHANQAPIDQVDRPDPRTTSVIAGSRLDLLDALERLENDHPQWVQPFMLRDIYDLPYADIADYLEMPLGTVKRHIHDARAWMRRSF
jgi:RNA polymerase sigma-70 factor, ECF subfamily